MKTILIDENIMVPMRDGVKLATDDDRLNDSSATPDTDFTGKLVDVYPDGRAIILSEGILRARHRSSFTDPELMEADKISMGDRKCLFIRAPDPAGSFKQ